MASLSQQDVQRIARSVLAWEDEERPEHLQMFDKLAAAIVGNQRGLVVDAVVNDSAKLSSDPDHYEADIFIFVNPQEGGRYSNRLKAVTEKLARMMDMSFVSLWTPRADRNRGTGDLAEFYRRNPYKLTVGYTVGDAKPWTRSAAFPDQVGPLDQKSEDAIQQRWDAAVAMLRKETEEVGDEHFWSPGRCLMVNIPLTGGLNIWQFRILPLFADRRAYVDGSLFIEPQWSTSGNGYPSYKWPLAIDKIVAALKGASPIDKIVEDQLAWVEKQFGITIPPGTKSDIKGYCNRLAKGRIKANKLRLKPQEFPIAQPTTASSVIAAAMKEWSDDDQTAPRTPWGKAQIAYQGIRGVTWYITAGHGGLCISAALARARLSPAALALGERYGGGYWYEEDCAWSAVAYEYPDWINSTRTAPTAVTKDEAEKTLRRWFPEYFTKTYQAPYKSSDLQPGMTLYFEGLTIKSAKFVEFTGRSMTIEDGMNYRLPRVMYDRNVVKIMDGDRVIWQKEK